MERYRHTTKPGIYIVISHQAPYVTVRRIGYDGDSERFAVYNDEIHLIGVELIGVGDSVVISTQAGQRSGSVIKFLPDRLIVQISNEILTIDREFVMKECL